MRYPKFNIYKEILCLETHSNEGPKFWDVGTGLMYKPCHISQINRVRFGVLKGTTRHVLAAHLEGQWVAINLPRSDLMAMAERGMLPTDLILPYDEIKSYSALPDGHEEDAQNSGHYA